MFKTKRIIHYFYGHFKQGWRKRDKVSINSVFAKLRYKYDCLECEVKSRTKNKS